MRLTSVDTASTTRAQATPVIEVEDDSPHNRPRAPDIADDAGTETLEDPVVVTAFPPPALAPVTPSSHKDPAEPAPASRGGRWLSLQRTPAPQPIDLDEDPLPKCQEQPLRTTSPGKPHRPDRRRPWKVHAFGSTF